MNGGGSGTGASGLFTGPYGYLQLRDIHIRIRDHIAVGIHPRGHFTLHVTIRFLSGVEFDTSSRDLCTSIRGRSRTIRRKARDRLPGIVATLVIAPQITAINLHRANLLSALAAELVPVSDRQALVIPAQIDIHATEGNEYHFVFVAKGGGSANKTYLYQETKAIINPKTLVPFLVEKMKTLGTAACPPYHIAFVIGGTSAEKNLETVKKASIKYYDNLPTKGNEYGHAFRDIELENELKKASEKIGLGAQFGGKYFAHDIRVIRLPRHGASCPIGMGVSCSADRNIKAKINREGLWLEKLDANPGELIPEELRKEGEGNVVKIDLNRPMSEVLAELDKFPVATRLSLSGTIIVGRDIAHAKIKERLDAGEPMPEYLKNHPIYYAGPAKTPAGMASGSFGPTTAGRMDPYVDQFQKAGGSMIMIAKGNRSQQVTDACKANGGFYLGSIGGPAAILAKDSIKKVELLEYPELGMEAIWKIEVENFPAFILVDNKGNDFFKQIQQHCAGCPVNK